MKRTILIIAIALFCSVTAQAQKPIQPARSYKQDGMTVVSPNQTGWSLLKADKSETLFEKRGEDGIFSASVKSVSTKTFETDQKRLAAWEAAKNEEFSKLKRDSLHFYYTRFKGAMCLRYDGTFPLEKTTSNNFARFNIRGFQCPLPNVKDSAIQVEFSNYSNTRGFTEDLFSLSDEFFEKVTFSSK